jgi:hypothetical protein
MTIARTLALSAVLLVLTAATTAGAQEVKPAAPKGVTTKGLVTSLGGFSATVSAPLALTGATVALEPGGQTGRQQFRVPTYIYVIEGALTTDYEAGPVGTKGVQYHTAGQSFMDNGSWWHNHANRTDKPVRYLMLHIGYPGQPAPVQKPEPE